MRRIRVGLLEGRIDSRGASSFGFRFLGEIELGLADGAHLEPRELCGLKGPSAKTGKTDQEHEAGKAPHGFGDLVQRRKRFQLCRGLFEIAGTSWRRDSSSRWLFTG